MEISGKITDETGEGIPAAVFISDNNGKTINPSIGINADINGSYKLTVPDQFLASLSLKMITAQFVGTTKQTKSLAPTVNFQLAGDNTLAEVEVTANAIKKPRIGRYIFVGLLIAGALTGAYMYFNNSPKTITT